MNSILKSQSSHFTVADYMTWPDDERWELIDGVAYDMSPAPTIKHQNVAGGLYALLREKLKGKTCQPFIAPVDVVLSAVDVVQPDVIVVCDPNKITERNIQGAPDWVAEILSPSTARKDLREKKALFERSGVKEYVIFDPTQGWVQRFVLIDGTYGPGVILDPLESLELGFMPAEFVPLADIFGLSSNPSSPCKP